MFTRKGITQQKLEADADFKYLAGDGREIYYTGTTRHELRDGGVHTLISTSEKRDWRKEFIEISQQLNSLRHSLLADLLIPKDPENLQRFPIPKHPKSIDPGLIYWVEDALTYKGIHFETPEYIERRSELGAGEDLIQRLQKERDENPQIVRNVAQRRSEQLQRALRILAPLDNLSVSIEADCGEVTSGVAGRALLLARGLLDALPNITVHLSTRDDQDALRDTIPEQFRSIVDRDRLAVRLDSKDPEATLRIGVWRGCGGYIEGLGVTCDFWPLPNVQRISEADDRYYRSPANNDLFDATGTLILDPSLKAARTEKDRWSVETLVTKREEFLTTVLSPDQREALVHAGLEAGFSVSEAIWSGGYIQDERRVMEEVELLAGLLDKHGVDAMPCRAAGKQIIIFLKAGHYAELDQRTLAELGVRQITEKGETITPSKAAQPITIVHVANLNNGDLRDFYSKLSGCAVRDGRDQHWIDFPVFVTGSASWLEGLSAGAITLHDNYDVTSNRKRNILEAVLRREIMLDPKCKNLRSVSEPAKERLAEVLLGEGDREGLYLNLEAWSARARALSSAMHKCNSADDLLIAWAEHIEQHGVPTPVDKSPLFTWLESQNALREPALQKKNPPSREL